MGKFFTTVILVMAVMFAIYFFNGNGFDPKTIEDKRVLITGASTGIGEQLAYHYSRLGARVVITARREDALKSVAKKCKELGARQIEIVVADMGNATDRTRVVDQTQEFLGGLDHLILNHALLIHGWWLGSPANMSNLESTFHVNYLSYVDIASKSMEMLTTSRGNIGVVSSSFGEMGTARSTIYSTYKFALHGFFSSLRQELIVKDKGISVTIVVLGGISTDTFMSMRDADFSEVPLGMISTPIEAARVILENVAQRIYKVRFNTFSRMNLFVHDLFPGYLEDYATHLLLCDKPSYVDRFVKVVLTYLYSG